MVQQDFQGKTISVEDLLGKYQPINHKKNWLDTVKGLATEEPQQSPFYFSQLLGAVVLPASGGCQKSFSWD